MKFKALFSVQPPSYFGLPEDDKTVMPAPCEVLGPSLDVHSGKLVDYGTLSRFRADSEKIQLAASLGEAALTVWDNFFELAFESQDPAHAIPRAVAMIQTLLRHLTIEQGDLFTFTFVQIAIEDGPTIPNPLDPSVQMLRLTAYDLKELTQRISLAASRAATTDARLEKALFYYEHARLLYNLRGQLPPYSDHSRLLIASVYLNAWKALTTVLGDPSTDGDYQRRFREFGFPKNFWNETVAPLKTVRDREDVAHYSLSDSAAATVEKSFGILDPVCRDVLRRCADNVSGSLKTEPRDASERSA